MYRLMLSGSLVSQFFQVVPITLLVGAVYTLARYRTVKRLNLSTLWWKELIRLLFVCYLTGLFNLVLVPNNFWSSIWFYLFNGYPSGSVGRLFQWDYNFVPSLYRCLTGELVLGPWVRTMLVGNVLMFIPFGLLFPLVRERAKFGRLMAVAFAVPAAIELLQPIVGRSCDVDDLLANVLGILIGYLLALPFRFWMTNLAKDRNYM